MRQNPSFLRTQEPIRRAVSVWHVGKHLLQRWYRWLMEWTAPYGISVPE